MKTTHYSATAKAYAQSLLDVATEQGTAQPVGEELSAIAGIFRDDEMLRLFAADPAIGTMERTGVVERSFGGGKVSPLVFGFLKILADRDALHRLGEIAGAYGEMLDERQGKVEVDVTVARRLSPEELEQVRQRIGAAIQRDAIVHQYVDESIVGGLVVQVGDKLIDGSVRGQLERMREQLLAARPR